MALYWYLVRSKRAAELQAQENLERQGYCVYFPRLYRPRRVRGSWRVRIASLFPTYLFVQADIDSQPLAPIRSTLGVADLVRFGSEYRAVSDDVIETLKRRECPETGLHRLDMEAAFRRGEQVRIDAGPFEGLEGVFQRPAGKDRVVILLQVLGMETSVKLASGIVIPQTQRYW
jgi:transcriptional antiterminator RfaH